MIDRLAYWYYVPREWLKKVALMDDVYLLNSPFTFQSMEKHAAYCAMMRLGPQGARDRARAVQEPARPRQVGLHRARYNQPFDLDAIAERIGYPLFMKPYDGGAWVGVTRIKNADDLHVAYDDSGQRLMHLQKAVEGYDVFARSLSIGAETMVMKFRPELPMHDRYEVGPRVPHARGRATRSSRSPGWSTRSSGGSSTPARTSSRAPRCTRSTTPTPARTSRSPRLHYYFPWAMAALVRWTVFALRHRAQAPPAPGHRRSTSRSPTARTSPTPRSSPPTGELADEYFETERYLDFCASRLAHLDEVVLEWVDSAEFDALLVETVRATYPAHEHDQFVAHFRGLVGMWVRDAKAATQPA